MQFSEVLCVVSVALRLTILYLITSHAYVINVHDWIQLMISYRIIEVNV